MRIEELLANEKFQPYGFIKPPKADYVLFRLEEMKLAEQYLWELNKPLEDQNDETVEAIRTQLQLD